MTEQTLLWTAFVGRVFAGEYELDEVTVHYELDDGDDGPRATITSVIADLGPAAEPTALQLDLLPTIEADAKNARAPNHRRLTLGEMVARAEYQSRLDHLLETEDRA